jgi:hypothetical protein
MSSASAKFVPAATAFATCTPKRGNKMKLEANTPNTAPAVLIAYKRPTVRLASRASL